MIVANNMTVLGLTYSPVKGPEGNIEYLVHIRKTANGENLCSVTAEDVVKASHEELDR